MKKMKIVTIDGNRTMKILIPCFLVLIPLVSLSNTFTLPKALNSFEGVKHTDNVPSETIPVVQQKQSFEQAVKYTE